MSRKDEKADFGKVAIALGFLTPDQLDEAMKLQEDSRGEGPERRLGEICLKNKILTREEVLLILRAQGKRIMVCSGCKRTYNVPRFRHDREYPCKRCGQAMHIPRSPVKARVDDDLLNSETRVLQRPKLDANLRSLLPGYELQELIGRGGMGTVYRAKDLILDRLVAVKLLSPLLAVNDEFVDRFFQEAQIAQKLNHPNIVQAFDAGIADPFKFFLMEYIEGPNLSDELKKSEHMAEIPALKIVKKIARGLAFAWKKRIIHRDIKPANIMLPDRKGVKICDMGLSKDVTSDISLTISGKVSCSPPYASPEQGRGDRGLDCRTDTYSLGVTLFQMVTGRLPFRGATPGALIIQHATQPPPDPRDINPAISPQVSALILRMMRKIPSHRPSPLELAEMIEEMPQMKKTQSKSG